MISGWGFICDPLRENGYGFIREVVRGDELYQEKRDLFFHKNDSDTADMSLDVGKLVKYKIGEGKKGFKAVDIEPLPAIPFAWEEQTRLGIIYSVRSVNFGFVQTENGELFLHMARVTESIQNLNEASASLFWVIAKQSSESQQNKFPEAVIAVPITALTLSQVEQVMRLPQPTRYHESESWSRKLLQVIEKHSAEELLVENLKATLTAKPSIFPVDFFGCLLQRWNNLAEIPAELRQAASDFAKTSYGEQWQLSSLAKYELPLEVKTLLVQTVPLSEIGGQPFLDPSDSDAELWQKIADDLEEGQNEAVPRALLIKAALRERTLKQRYDKQKELRQELEKAEKTIKELRLELKQAEDEQQKLRQELEKANREKKKALEHNSSSSIRNKSSRSHSGPKATITPIYKRHNVPDAAQIRAFVQQRGIKKLVHLTKMSNLRGICEKGAILSRDKLDRWDSSKKYERFDSERYDGYNRHVNCSISYYNFHTFYRLIKNKEQVVLLYIRPDYLWKERTLYSPINAATKYGAHVDQGLKTLQELFQDEVTDNVGRQTRINKPDHLPTCIQAEVLVPDGIVLEDVMEVVVRNRFHQRDVREAGWHGKIRVAYKGEDDKDFRYCNEWISKDKFQPSDSSSFWAYSEYDDDDFSSDEFDEFPE